MEKELQNIIQAACALFKRYGIKSVSMDDIARELAMSKKTLYQHIKDKNELVEKVLINERDTRGVEFSDIFKKSQNAIDELIAVNSFVKKMLENSSLSFEFDLEKYYPQRYKQMMEYKEKNIFENITKNMQKGIAEGLYREDLKCEVIAGLYVSRISSSHFLEFIAKHESQLNLVHREIMIYHIRGIANAKGLEFLEQKIKNNEI